jgi:hypothetical protein
MEAAMRLHPVAPLLTPRLFRQDVSVDGYDIMAGTASSSPSGLDCNQWRTVIQKQGAANCQ